MPTTLEMDLLQALDRVTSSAHDVCDRYGQAATNIVIADAIVLGLVAMEEHLRFAVKQVDEEHPRNAENVGVKVL